MCIQMKQRKVMNELNQSETLQNSNADLGKQLLESAIEGDTNKLHDLLCRGAPFHTDKVRRRT